jgi:hypothetical protein
MISQNTRLMVGFRYGYSYNLFCEITNDVDLVDELSGDDELIGNSMFRFYTRVDYWRMKNWFWMELKCIWDCIEFYIRIRGEAYAKLQEFFIRQLDWKTDVEIVYNWKFLFTVKYQRLLDILDYYRRSAVVGKTKENRRRGGHS